jgi:signal transduction histidine kinase
MTLTDARYLTGMRKRLLAAWLALVAVLVLVFAMLACCLIQDDPATPFWIMAVAALVLVLLAGLCWHWHNQAVHLHQAATHRQQAAQSQDEILSFLSHDMRSPQSAILSIIELRRQAPGRWSEEAVLAHIEQQTRTTLDLVDHFVQLGRAESAVLNRHPCYLDELIQECSDRRWPGAEQRDIKLRFEARHPDAVAEIDSELMGRAIGILLDNALLYSPPHSTVECRLEDDGRLWRIHVQDAGPGMAPEQLARLFDRFQRGTNKTGKPVGSGLGLAFVRTVAQRHGGQASCVSTPGHGACFTISLPADGRTETEPVL